MGWARYKKTRQVDTNTLQVVTQGCKKATSDKMEERIRKSGVSNQMTKALVKEQLKKSEEDLHPAVDYKRLMAMMWKQLCTSSY